MNFFYREIQLMFSFLILVKSVGAWSGGHKYSVQCKWLYMNWQNGYFCWSTYLIFCLTLDASVWQRFNVHVKYVWIPFVNFSVCDGVFVCVALLSRWLGSCLGLTSNSHQSILQQLPPKHKMSICDISRGQTRILLPWEPTPILASCQGSILNKLLSQTLILIDFR